MTNTTEICEVFGIIFFLCILHPGTCWESGNRNADPPERGSLWLSQTHASLSVPSLCPVAEDIITSTTPVTSTPSMSYVIILYEYHYISYSSDINTLTALYHNCYNISISLHHSDIIHYKIGFKNNLIIH